MVNLNMKVIFIFEVCCELPQVISLHISLDIPAVYLNTDVHVLNHLVIQSVSKRALQL
jgi:hypothetical protein